MTSYCGVWFVFGVLLLVSVSASSLTCQLPLMSCPSSIGDLTIASLSTTAVRAVAMTSAIPTGKRCVGHEVKSIDEGVVIAHGLLTHGSD